MEPFTPTTGDGTGFVFQDASGEALLTAVTEALGVFGNPRAWRQLVRNAMARDFSWSRSAARYVDLYQRTLAATRRASTT